MNNSSLNRRLMLTTLVVAALVMSVFAVAIAFVSDRLEHGVLDQLVIKEYGEIERRLALDANAHLPNTAQLRAWLTDKADDKTLPSALRKLPVGIFHEVEFGGSEYHVLRQPVEDRFLTLAFEINLVEARELQLKFVLLFSVIAGPAMVLILSYVFTRRLTRPVTRLAEILSGLDPGQRNVRLAEDFDGQEVEAIARAFDRYQERLDLLVEREQSFSAAASHELRTPLAVIAASTELLQANEHLPENAEKQAMRISKAVYTMTELVNSLLTLSRDRRQKPTSPLQIQPLIEEAVANYRTQLDGKEVEIGFDCDPELTLWIPTGDILIVLGNLLQNAIRNTERGTIRIKCDRESLVVQDTGRGMPREFAAHIFDKHVQAQDSHGVGLGLHIVKRLCDRYGWPIEVQSALGEGTEVTVFWSSVE